MNILFLNKYPACPSQGGIERVTYLLANEFIKIGHSVSCIYTEDESKVSLELKKYSYISYHINNADDKEAIKDILYKVKPDVIINQHLVPKSFEILKYITSVNPNIKIISVLHNRPFATYGIERKYKSLTYPSSLKGNLIKYFALLFPALFRKEDLRMRIKMLQNILEVSNKLCLLSKQFESRILQFMPDINVNQLESINNPNTFPIEDASNLRKENLIIFVGRMEDPQKNVKGFIDVWNLFSEKHKDWKAMIIGDGPHKHIFEKYAEKKKSRNLTFEGNQRDIANYYKKAKFLCMTSLYEGWPMVLAEAMSYRCVPFVFDTFEAVHDIIINGNTGILVNPFNSNLMASYLDHLAGNDSEREQIAENAQQHINKFDVSIIAREWLDKMSHLIEIETDSTK